MRTGSGRSLIEIISRAMEEAQQRGRDRGSQIDDAVAAVLMAESDLIHTAAWWRHCVHEPAAHRKNPKTSREC